MAARYQSCFSARLPSGHEIRRAILAHGRGGGYEPAIQDGISESRSQPPALNLVLSGRFDGPRASGPDGLNCRRRDAGGAPEYHSTRVVAPADPCGIL